MRLILIDDGAGDTAQPAGSAFRFTRQQRLLAPQEFKQVFRSGRRRRLGAIEVITLHNSAGLARLGLVIPKRAVRRAVNRNRIRRWAREAFRLRQHRLPACDIVLRIHAAALTHEDLDAALDQLVKVKP